MTNEIQTIQIVAGRAQEAKKALDKMLKKAARYGCADVSAVFGAEYEVETKVRDWNGKTVVKVASYVDITVSGEAPTVGNHEFLAHVELGSAGNIVDTVPGVEDIDHKFRESDGYCEHCNTSRNRRDVYVVKCLDTGQQLQVGRTCLRDFMGTDDPAKIVNRFKFYRELSGFGEDAGWGFGSYSWAASSTGLLGLAATCVRLFGWCSKGQACGGDMTSTSVYVDLAAGERPRGKGVTEAKELWDRIHKEHNEADQIVAEATLNWVRNDWTDTSDYAHNLKTVLAADILVDPKRIGLVISAVAAYHRAIEKELRLTEAKAKNADSKHMGEVGERLKGMVVTKESGRVIGGSQWGDTVLIKFRDEAGNVFCWFTGGGSGLQDGEQCTLDGTVKQHNEFQGMLETQLTRCKVHPLK